MRMKTLNQTFTKVYSSDLSRAHHTAQLVLKHSGNEDSEIQKDVRLRERVSKDLQNRYFVCWKLITNFNILKISALDQQKGPLQKIFLKKRKSTTSRFITILQKELKHQ